MKSLIIPAIACTLIATGALLASPGEAEATTVIVHGCPPGTHAGYLGRHCWPNLARACPPGWHLGWRGRHCWRNQ